MGHCHPPSIFFREGQNNRLHPCCFRRPVQRVNLLILHTSSICLPCRVRLSSTGNPTGYSMDFPHNLLILMRPLFFPSIPLLLFSMPILAFSRSRFSMSRFKVSETFSISFEGEWALLVRFLNPFLGQEPEQLPIPDKYFDLSSKYHAILCRMSMIPMVFAELTTIPFKRICFHPWWPSKGGVPLYGHKHFGEVGVQGGEHFWLEPLMLYLPRLTFEEKWARLLLPSLGILFFLRFGCR